MKKESIKNNLFNIYCIVAISAFITGAVGATVAMATDEDSKTHKTAERICDYSMNTFLTMGVPLYIHSMRKIFK